MSHAAKFMLTPELFVHALHLPEDTVIRAVEMLPGQLYIRVICEHPDLKEGAFGEGLPEALPTFTRDAGGAIAFAGWGQK